ncbi:MAG TPA: hypothetical protein VGV90_10750 [Solirubrobacteraceae bacterium]|nr:hypothetical protein [Solirubrobacteraceae bacterium]
MTPQRTSTGIAALDELGRRMDAVVEPPRLRRLRPRRWAALALGVLAVVATPALAAVVFDRPERVEDALPEVAAAIDRDDPAATGRALAQLGYRVQWTLITDNPARGRDGASPTRWRAVTAPPAGTEILSVSDKDGGLTVDRDTRELQIEVAPVGSDILATHR